MKYAIGIANPAGGPDFLKTPTRFVRSYDPNAMDGFGLYTETGDPSKALLFDTFEAAWEAWRQQGTKRPFRPDGRPNRPLTALTVSIVSMGEDGQ